MATWLRFEDDTVPGARTQRLIVWSIRGPRLGAIQWFGRWRQYAFFPEAETVFNRGCLQDIEHKVTELQAAMVQRIQAERKQRRA